MRFYIILFASFLIHFRALIVPHNLAEFLIIRQVPDDVGDGANGGKQQAVDIMPPVPEPGDQEQHPGNRGWMHLLPEDVVKNTRPEEADRYPSPIQHQQSTVNRGLPIAAFKLVI